MNRLLITVFAVLLTGGCATATVGKPFPGNNVALLRPGLSTTEEARSLLGEPHQVQINAAGEQLYTWQYIRSDATSGLVSMNVQTNTQQAALVFGADGRLLRVHNLINVPAPMPASAVTTASSNQAESRGTGNIASTTKEQQLDELSRTPGLSYEEYQRRYRVIMGQ